MSSTVTFRNCGLRAFAHPQMGTMPATPTATKTKTFKTVNADVYSSNYSSLAKFGIHVVKDSVDVAGSVVVTGTATITTAQQMVVVDMTANMTLTLPALADVATGHMITIYLRSRTGGTLTIDGNASETVLGSANQTSTTVGYTLRIKKESATNWAVQTV